MQVNHLAPFYISRALRPVLAASERKSIIDVASAAQLTVDLDDLMMSGRWSAPVAYARSKLAMIMAGMALAAELDGDGIRVNAVNPARLMPTAMTSELSTLASRKWLGRLLKRRLRPRDSLEVGVANVLRLAIAAPGAAPTGRYFDGEREKRPHRQARDPAAVARLNALSQGYCEAALATPPSPSPNGRIAGEMPFASGAANGRLSSLAGDGVCDVGGRAER
jgi:NAD(P)-dependent dehydrogenase (short-subunit alcohol dehydrogenase family)